MIATGLSGTYYEVTAKRYIVVSALVVLALALFLHLGATTTLAQCVMCRASLGNNSTFIRNFNIGVLVLLVPPVSIFCTIFIIAFRHRRSG